MKIKLLWQVELNESNCHCEQIVKKDLNEFFKLKVNQFINKKDEGTMTFKSTQPTKKSYFQTLINLFILKMISV